ncbi:hypothetical protein MRX96_010619 [Rhipicephalus microplus]
MESPTRRADEAFQKDDDGPAMMLPKRHVWEWRERVVPDEACAAPWGAAQARQREPGTIVDARRQMQGCALRTWSLGGIAAHQHSRRAEAGGPDGGFQGRTRMESPTRRADEAFQKDDDGPAMMLPKR